MKQNFVFLILIIFSLMLQACSQIIQPADTPTVTVTFAERADTPTVTITFAEPAVTPAPLIFEPLNACDNFFLPMETGTTWTYSDGTVLSVGGFEGDDSTGSIMLIKLNPDASLEKQYIHCSNGKTEIMKIATLDKDLNETGSQTMSEISNGACESRIILPEAENMIAGKAWQECTTSCHVVNDQTLIIQLGSFKTRRVECEDGTIRWYAPQFGLMKTCAGKKCSELIEFTAPN
jgi:hypothetical protein